MITVLVKFSDGDEITTGINATLAEAKAYYIGQYFTTGGEDFGIPERTRVGMSCELVPHTYEEIRELAKGNHYVLQLIALKSMFGSSAKLGFVGYERCGTVADMIRQKIVGSEWLYIDDLLPLIPQLNQQMVHSLGELPA